MQEEGRIPGIEPYSGKLYELPASTEQEVLTELEFHQNMAIRHTDEADRHLALSIEEYIAGGEHLLEVKARMEHGKFIEWIERDYSRSRHQANKYMRVARHKDQLSNVARELHLSLNAALKMLAEPKEEKPEPIQEDDLLKDHEAIEDVIDEPSEYDQQLRELQEKTSKLRKAEAKVKAEAEKVKERKEAIEAKEREAEEKATQLEEKITSLDQKYAEAIAVIQAKYGEEEQPGWADIPAEAWSEAFAEAKSVRVMQVGNSLLEIYSWPRWMSEYFPGEAADAIADMSHGKEVAEGLRYVVNWLERVLNEVEAKYGEEIKHD